MTALVITLSILLISMLYVQHQIKRNDRVYNIRLKWIEDNDKRYKKYTYNEMFMPSKSNWWGLTYPREKDFKQ